MNRTLVTIALGASLATGVSCAGSPDKDRVTDVLTPDFNTYRDQVDLFDLKLEAAHRDARDIEEVRDQALQSADLSLGEREAGFQALGVFGVGNVRRHLELKLQRHPAAGSRA